MLGILGAGYGGLVRSVCLAQLGNTVTAIDKDPDIVASLSDGRPTIHEPGLQELLTKNLEAVRVCVSAHCGRAAAAGELLFLCVLRTTRADCRRALAPDEQS